MSVCASRHLGGGSRRIFGYIEFKASLSYIRACLNKIKVISHPL